MAEWLLHVLSKHIYDLFNVFRRKWLILLYTDFNITASQVRRELERLNQRKEAGPDRISPRVLKACASQLCGVLQHLFNLSLQLQRVPVLWKTSCLVPVPKKGHPVALDDYRPIALTSHIMKVMERLVLAHLRPLVCPSEDPLQLTPSSPSC